MAENSSPVMHLWTNEPGQVLHHMLTNIWFVCTRNKPGPANSENWDVRVLDGHAVNDMIFAQAKESGMSADDYVTYLAETAIELADKAERKYPRKRMKF